MTWTILQGDARHIPLADESVHCVVTSPRKPNGQFQKGTHWRPRKTFWDKAWLETEYSLKRRSAAEIAAEVGCTENNILFWLKKHSIQTRTVSEVRAIKHWGLFGEKNPMFGKVGAANPRYVDGSSPERQRLYAQSAGRQFLVTVPEEIPLRCIKAGTSDKGCCAKCGAPWVRVVERPPVVMPEKTLTAWQRGDGAHDRIPVGRYHGPAYQGNPGPNSRIYRNRDPAHQELQSHREYGGNHAVTDPTAAGRRILQRVKVARDNGGDHDNPFQPARTLGWRPSCKCGVQERKPCVVLDPFSGAGTTLLVADKLGRIGIGLDAQGDYCQMARKRLYQDAPLLTEAP